MFAVLLFVLLHIAVQPTQEYTLTVPAEDIVQNVVPDFKSNVSITQKVSDSINAKHVNVTQINNNTITVFLHVGLPVAIVSIVLAVASAIAFCQHKANNFLKRYA